MDALSAAAATPPRKALSGVQRIVIKLGTGVVTRDGVELALGRLYSIVEDIAALIAAGQSVLLVSSGAVGMGLRALGHRQRPTSLGQRQAYAAIGQGKLMALYTQAFAQEDITVAQVLLTQEDLADRDRALCLRTTLTRLLELGTLPILNENDSVSVRELIEHRDDSPSDAGDGNHQFAFGDNDGLSARVAIGMDADLLVLMSDVDGVCTGNPSVDPDARRIAELRGIDEATLALASGASAGGTGGMLSKLQAARTAAEAGTAVLILDGGMPRALARAMAGEDIGTIVWPTTPRKARRQRIAHGRPQRGALVINDGALAALVERKASLLPVGVTAVDGAFVRGDVVEIRDVSGRVHGRGIANYDAPQCTALAGHRSEDIDRVVGFRGDDALVSRDNLVLSEV
ncbi:MAG: glutamate 5-kinase [Nannocystaceae bacterium]|nr:glutamate 5-kinase [Nannocystaceae bacterium]